MTVKVKMARAESIIYSVASPGIEAIRKNLAAAVSAAGHQRACSGNVWRARRRLLPCWLAEGVVKNGKRGGAMRMTTKPVMTA